MNKIIAIAILSTITGMSFAQAVSAPTMLPDGTVSAPSVNSEDVSATATAMDVSAPYVAASIGAMDCCAVSVSAHVAANKVSIPNAAEDESGALAMAGMGFGLFSLVGVMKLARRKKAKSTETI